MAYLPMTMAFAVPNISVAEQTQAMADMGMKNCHDQQNNTSNDCGHCTDQFNCNNATNSCSTSVSLVSHSHELNNSQDAKALYLTFHDSTLFQRSNPLLRPPISL